MTSSPSESQKIAIVGGGAAGFFCAINAADLAVKNNLNIEVHIFESSNQYLKKVRISGGGRCNVTHNLFEVRPFTENYPRGSRELLSPFQKFQAKDTIEWFKKEGVEIVAESDGRMFPETNTSETIIDCYLQKAEKLNVKLHPKSPIKKIEKKDQQIELFFKEGDSFIADSVLIATGSAEAGYRLAESLGHTITERAPSLFSFKIKDSLLNDLSGLSFNSSALKIKIKDQKTFKQTGPMLITHWGLSGPAILKLSAWAAREMKRADYSAQLFVNWLNLEKLTEVEELLKTIKEQNTKNHIKNAYPTELSKRFWQNLLMKLAIDPEKQWANINKKEFSKLANALFNYEFEVLGQNRFKDEFVECGGVSLKEINFKTMESKICPNLYFAGEILDVDGITGGFNFQNAWSTAWIAAHSMINS